MPETPSSKEFLMASAAIAAAAALGVGSASAENTASVTMPATSNKGIPTGKLGPLTVSRLFIGGNQLSGYAHCRDLRYVAELMRTYLTDEKVFATWALCEELGINTILTDPFERPVQLMKEYRKIGGKLQWISEVHPAMSQYQMTLQDLKENVKQVADNGPQAIYVQGSIPDVMVKEGRVNEVVELIAAMKATGLPSGIGAHSIETPKALLKVGIMPDFFVKTHHPDSYYTATPREMRVEFNVDSGSSIDHDNIWDIFPEETRKVMGQIEKPWIAFKVLAAGAVSPEEGFKYAFEGGADFICVGMFDFHVKNNVETLKKVLSGEIKRTRPWRA